MSRVRGPSRRSGFTLIETIVVIIVISLLATVLIPRLTSTRKQRFELFAAQVADLMMMFAQRDNLGRLPIGLMIDTNGPVPSMQVVVRQADATDAYDWTTDRFVRPVKLPEFVRPSDIMVSADGEIVNMMNWVLGHVPGENRPAIEITLRDDSGVHRAVLALSSYGISPTRRDESRSSTRGARTDLDSEGRSMEDW